MQRQMPTSHVGCDNLVTAVDMLGGETAAALR
jgi:hypothetical protein